MKTRETSKVEYPESSMVPEMSDSEFLSFLYSERNRENDISQYQGWNTWVLAIIPVICCISAVYWCWLIVLFVETAVLIVGLCNRDRIVPYYFHRTYFPEPSWNIIYSGLSSGLFYEAWYLSFRAASWRILCPEFEAGVCIATFIILIYWILRINVDNKVVKAFDSIIDMYLYAGVTKEQTYQKILCNRMGYGLIEICQKKLKEIEGRIKKCEEMGKEVTRIKQELISGKVDRTLLHRSTLKMKQILNYLKESLNQTKKLSDKLDEILKVVPVFTNISDINTIFDTNKELYEKIQIVDGELDELSDLLRDSVIRHYCRKTNSLCEVHDCDARNDSMCWKYAIERRKSTGTVAVSLRLKTINDTPYVFPENSL